jgi:hypothetical protein
VKRSYTIVIDDKVLLPRKGERGPLVHPLPFMLSKLEIGESFAWPETKANWILLRSIASKEGRRHGKRYPTRMVTEGGNKKLRFWRTA